jgi:hypothetical protein
MQDIHDLGVECTVNLVRIYILQAANEALHEGKIEESLDMAVFFQGTDEPDYNPDDTIGNARFTLSKMRVWKVTPDEEEEQAAAEKPPEKPTLPAEIREWEIAGKFDHNTKVFGAEYLTNFAGEALYNMLSTDVDASTQYWQSLQTRVVNAKAAGKYRLATKAAQECSSIVVFANAYLSTLSAEPFSKESFDEFRAVFAARGIVGQFYKTLGNGARRNAIFNQFFSEVSQKASYEQDHHDEIMIFMQRSATPGENEDLRDLGAMLETYKDEIRSKCYETLLTNFFSWLVERSKEFSATECLEAPQARVGHLLALSDEFERHVCKDRLSKEDQEIYTKITLRIGDAIKHLGNEVSNEIFANDAPVDLDLLACQNFKVELNNLNDVKSHQISLERYSQALLDNVQTQFAELGMHGAEDAATREGVIVQLSENIQYIDATMKKAGVASPMDATIVHKLLARGMKVLKAGLSYNADLASQNAKNFTALNKAYVEFGAMDSIVKKGSKEVALVESILRRNLPLRDQYLELARVRVTAHREKLTSTVKEYYRHARGARSGKSWKIDIDKTASLEEVLKVANVEVSGLLHCPGGKKNEQCKGSMQQAFRNCIPDRTGMGAPS